MRALSSLPLPGYIALLRIIETQSIDLSKLLRFIHEERCEELGSLILSSIYAMAYERAMALKSPETFESDVIQLISRHLEDIKRYGTSELQDLIALFEALIDLDNLIGTITSREPRLDALLPLGRLYQCLRHRGDVGVESVKECIERSALANMVGFEEIEAASRDRRKVTELYLNARIRIWRGLIDSIDRKRKYFSASPQIVREIATLDIAQLSALSKQLGVYEVFKSVLKDVFECDVEQQRLTTCLGVYRQRIVESSDRIANTVFREPERATLMFIDVLVNDLIPFLRVPGDNLDLLVYVLIAKVYELRLLRYAFMICLRRAEQ